jgi:protein TonB
MGRWVAAANESPSPLPSPSGPPPKATDNRKLKLTYNPAPKYPSEARYSRVRGSGRFRVTFGTGGEATEVQVIESTGKSVLDQAATASLRQWKSEPGHEWSLVVPITFEP